MIADGEDRKVLSNHAMIVFMPSTSVGTPSVPKYIDLQSFSCHVSFTKLTTIKSLITLKKAIAPQGINVTSANLWSV